MFFSINQTYQIGYINKQTNRKKKKKKTTNQPKKKKKERKKERSEQTKKQSVLVHLRYCAIKQASKNKTRKNNNLCVIQISTNKLFTSLVHYFLR